MQIQLWKKAAQLKDGEPAFDLSVTAASTLAAISCNETTPQTFTSIHPFIAHTVYICVYGMAPHVALALIPPCNGACTPWARWVHTRGRLVTWAHGTCIDMNKCWMLRIPAKKLLQSSSKIQNDTNVLLFFALLYPFKSTILHPPPTIRWKRTQNGYCINLYIPKHTEYIYIL